MSLSQVESSAVIKRSPWKKKQKGTLWLSIWTGTKKNDSIHCHYQSKVRLCDPVCNLWATHGFKSSSELFIRDHGPHLGDIDRLADRLHVFRNGRNFDCDMAVTFYGKLDRREGKLSNGPDSCGMVKCSKYCHDLDVDCLVICFWWTGV